MTSVRDQLALAISTDNPGLDVVAWGHEPTELRKPLVVVFRSDVEQAGAQLVHRFTLQLFTQAGLATQEAEDALDDVLDAVLLSLRRLDVVAFEKATRKVFLDRFQGWDVEAVWTSQDYYKSTVLTEG